MKKIMNFNVLFLFVLFIAMGCEPDPPDPSPMYPKEIKSKDDLLGTWEFVNVQKVGNPTLYTKCEEVDFAFFSFNFYKENGEYKCKRTDICDRIPDIVDLYRIWIPGDPAADFDFSLLLTGSAGSYTCTYEGNGALKMESVNYVYKVQKKI
jgi:hypothetical protein